MLMPSIFGENLFDDDWMDFPFKDEFWGSATRSQAVKSLRTVLVY